ncbi:MAG: serine hydrolase domain-containing protein [Bryobacteraceae bacterium]
MNREHQLKQVIQKYVDEGQIAGAAAAVWRDGVMQAVWAGWRDIELRLPVERDTIFRIASMTKPITSVAALMLVEEGRIALSDPISDYAPEFAKMRVLRRPDGPLEDNEECARPITVEDLLTHRSGLTYADFQRGPIARAYREALGRDIDIVVAPDDWIRRLAELPLVGQPGSAMYYGLSTDLLGFLIARIEGPSLGAVLERRIFGPLGMKDTGFTVPSEKRSRRASTHGFDDHGRLIRRTTWGSDPVLPERPPNMAYESGGAGLWSTLDDYTTFARLFLCDGAVDGVRLLHPETLRVMMSNHLTDTQRQQSCLLGQKPFAVGRGFGLGLSVVLETAPTDFMRRGGTGTVSWPGAFGGWWQADQGDNSVFLFLAHNMVDLAQMGKGIGLGVWAAIEEFQAAAMRVEREPAA